ncbi:N-acetylmuramoyl-L-alanine amidase [bacterium]|nr:MAG: N-acetylmuramoyl-L-alanine amidase [bacterium]
MRQKDQRPATKPGALRVMLNACYSAKNVSHQVRHNLSTQLTTQAQKFLTQAGFRVIAARQDGQALSLLEHVDLAQQLNADLLIIVAINHQKRAVQPETIIQTSYSAGPISLQTHHGFWSLNMPPGNFLSLLHELPIFTTEVCQKIATTIHHNISRTFHHNQNMRHSLSQFSLISPHKTPFMLLHLAITFHDNNHDFVLPEKDHKSLARHLAHTIQQYSGTSQTQKNH